MNDFELPFRTRTANLWATIALSFAISSLFLWSALFVLQARLPTFECSSFETAFASRLPQRRSFDRVSLTFWASLCHPRNHGVIISASEGTGAPSFSSLALREGYHFDEFAGAHRGIKTSAYIHSFAISSTRQKGLRTLTLVNPVYFDFAAKSDAAALRRTAPSTASYIVQIPHWRLLKARQLSESLFVAGKNSTDDLQEMLQIFTARLPPQEQATEQFSVAPPEDYDLKLGLLNSKREHYGRFNSSFETLEPTQTALRIIEKRIGQTPTTPSCVVLLPINGRLLQANGRSPEDILQRLRRLFSDFPTDHWIDLTDLSEASYIFQDSMHFTEFGKLQVWKGIHQSDCFQKYFSKK